LFGAKGDSFLEMIIALDIEGRGPSPKRHGIVSIGMCVSTPDGSTRQRQRFSMGFLPGQSFETRCMTEFWSVGPRMALLEELTKEAVDPREAMTTFRQVIDTYDEPYIIVDCPAYDITFINYYLDHFDLPLLQFDAKGSFRPIHDADSYTRGKLEMGLGQVWVDNDAASERIGLAPVPKGNHMPDLDAEHILLHHLQMIKGTPLIQQHRRRRSDNGGGGGGEDDGRER
jgi:hypothetical protein